MQNLKRVPHFLLLLLFISLPLSKAGISAAMVGLLLFALLECGFGKVRWPKRRYFVLCVPALVFIALAFSLLYTENIKHGLRDLNQQNALVVFPFFCYVFRHLIYAHWRQYLSAFVAASTATAVLILFFATLSDQYLEQLSLSSGLLSDYDPDHKRTAFGAYSPFMDRLQLGYLLGITLMLQIWRCIQGVQLLWNALIALVVFAAFMLLGARGAQLAFLATLPLWLIYAYQKYLRKYIQRWMHSILPDIMMGLLVVFIVLGTPYLAYKNIRPIADRYDQLLWEVEVYYNGDLKAYDYLHFTTVRRILSWQHTWQLIQEHPIVGVGIGDYEDEMKVLYAQDDLGYPVNYHHQFMYYWVTGGVLALLSFLVSCVWFFYQFWKQRKRSVAVLGPVFSIFYLVVFMFDVPLLYHVGSATYFTFFCLLLLLLQAKGTSSVK
ncbi:MAG: O-antigen ligase family protein [Bacteroidota bacterium]